jgi:glycosyltransferase involved in cell wall biosynthesis
LDIQKSIAVIYVCPHVDGYGADRSLLNNVIQLKNMGVRPIFLLPKEGLLSKYLLDYNIEYHIVKYKLWTKGYSRNLVILRLKAIAKLVMNYLVAARTSLHFRKSKIDIVHTNDQVTNFGMYLASFLKVKHVFHGRCLLHESEINFDFGILRSLKLADKYSSSVIFNSHTVFDYYNPYYSIEKHIIYSGIFSKTDLLSLGETLPSNSACFRFVFIGRYENQKDPFTILKAIHVLVSRRVKNFVVHFFGHTGEVYADYYNKMQVYTKMNSLQDYVEFNDFVPDINRKLKNYNAGIFSSPMEGIARVVIEYMVNHLPVIGPRTGGAFFLIKDRHNGLLFRPGNAEDLADKMAMMISNRNQVVLMAKNAFSSVAEEFSSEYTSEKILHVYRGLLEH